MFCNEDGNGEHKYERTDEAEKAPGITIMNAKLTLPIENIGLVKVLPESLIVGLRWRAMVELELATILSGSHRVRGSLPLNDGPTTGKTTGA